MNGKVTFGSLFTGIGGIDLGFERAGMECRWQVEIDPWCRKVLTRHWPNVARYEDVREVGKHNLEPVDIIAGGFPCQPHSLAGKRKASSDERDLWGEFARIGCELNPFGIMGENVPGLLSSESGRFFGRVLRDLAGCGYLVEWQSLSAAAFGAPHIRERVILFAHRESSGTWRLPVSTWGSQQESVDVDGICEVLADTYCERFETSRPSMSQEWKATNTMFGDRSERISEYSWWKVEPEVGRVVDGLPRRVDRLRGLGNAVVPQVAEYVGREIVRYMESL